MGEVNQIEIINQTYYFYKDMINLKHFGPNPLEVDKKSCKNIGIHNIGYLAIKEIDEYESTYRVNPSYLRVNHVGNKYLIFDTTDDNKELQKKYKDVWNRIKTKINAINSGECDYEKDYMKIKFNSDDD